MKNCGPVPFSFSGPPYPEENDFGEGEQGDLPKELIDPNLPTAPSYMDVNDEGFLKAGGWVWGSSAGPDSFIWNRRACSGMNG